MRRQLAVSLLVAAALCASHPAHAAEEGAPTGHASSEPALDMFLGAKVGAAFRQPFSRFGTAVAPQVEIGKLLWNRRLAVLCQFGFTREVLRGSVAQDDPRLAAGPLTWKLTEWDLVGSVGLLVRHERRRTAGYAGVLASMHLQESRSQGRSGELLLGDVRERSTAFGTAALFGGEVSLGTSAIIGEAEVSWVKLDHTITGDTNLAAIAARLGYRLYF